MPRAFSLQGDDSSLTPRKRKIRRPLYDRRKDLFGGLGNRYVIGECVTLSDTHTRAHKCTHVHMYVHVPTHRGKWRGRRKRGSKGTLDNEGMSKETPLHQKSGWVLCRKDLGRPTS